MSSVSMWAPWKKHSHKRSKTFSKRSPTGPTERTPTPEYVIPLGTYLGVCSFWVSLFVFFEPGKIRSTGRWFSRRDPTTDSLFGGHQQPQPPSFFGSRENQTPQKGHKFAQLPGEPMLLKKLLVTGCIYIFGYFIYIYIWLAPFFYASFLEIFRTCLCRMLNFLRSLGLIRHLDSFLFGPIFPGEKRGVLWCWLVFGWSWGRWGIHMSRVFFNRCKEL